MTREEQIARYGVEERYQPNIVMTLSNTQKSMLFKAAHRSAKATKAYYDHATDCGEMWAGATKESYKEYFSFALKHCYNKYYNALLAKQMEKDGIASVPVSLGVEDGYHPTIINELRDLTA